MAAQFDRLDFGKILFVARIAIRLRISIRLRPGSIATGCRVSASAAGPPSRASLGFLAVLHLGFDIGWSLRDCACSRFCIGLGGVLTDRLANHGFRTTFGGLALRRLPPDAGAAIGLGFRVTVGALLLVDQRLSIGDGNLVVVRMDFAECQETMAVAAVVDERRLQRRLDPRYLSKVDVASQLTAACRFKIEFLNAVAA